MPQLIMRDIATQQDHLIHWPDAGGLPAKDSYIWWSERSWRVIAVWHRADDGGLVGLVTVIEDTVVEAPFKKATRKPVSKSGG